jgi:hypothetical protein
MVLRMLFVAIIASTCVTFGNAQIICTTNEERTLLSGCASYNTFSNYPPDSTIGPIYVKFHVIRTSLGSMDSALGRPLNDPTLYNLGVQLKSAFESNNIKIHLSIVPMNDYIDNDSIYAAIANDPTVALLGTSISRDTSNTINVYFGPSTTFSFALYNVGAPYGTVYIACDQYYLSSLGYHAVTLIHELGHIFGLYYGERYITSICHELRI